MSLAPGARLGPYEIVSPLGAGGMGEVYRARDTRLGREVAIKLASGFARDPERLQRIDREARTLASLNHPNIAAIYGLAKSGADGEVSADLSHSPTLPRRATMVGTIFGTAAYMSPEQARGKTLDRRTDVWSFCCVLYECLAGRPRDMRDVRLELVELAAGGARASVRTDGARDKSIAVLPFSNLSGSDEEGARAGVGSSPHPGALRARVVLLLLRHVDGGTERGGGAPSSGRRSAERLGGWHAHLSVGLHHIPEDRQRILEVSGKPPSEVDCPDATHARHSPRSPRDHRPARRRRHG